MAVPREKRFTVFGKFPFPLDMLRYDSCYPNAESDSAKIHTTFHKAGELVEVELATRSTHAPSIGRWESFCWRVAS